MDIHCTDSPIGHPSNSNLKHGMDCRVTGVILMYRPSIAGEMSIFIAVSVSVDASYSFKKKIEYIVSSQVLTEPTFTDNQCNVCIPSGNYRKGMQYYGKRNQNY